MTGRTRGLRGLDNIRGVERIVAIALVDSVGTGLYLAGGVLFFNKSVGLGTAQIGTGLSLAAFCGFLTQYPFGRLADRLGAQRVLVGLLLWRAVGMAAYGLAHDFVTFVVIACMLGIAERADSPIFQAVVAVVVPGERRVRTMAVYNATRNLGFSLGVLLALPALHSGARGPYLAVMLGDAVTFVLAAVLVAQLPVGARRPGVDAGRWLTNLGGILRDRRFLAFTGLNGILALHMTVLTVALPLWIADHTRAPTWTVSPLIAVNTVLAMVLQVRFSRGSIDLSGAARAGRNAGLALAVAALAFAFSGRLGVVAAVAVLLVAVVAHTCGEMWQAASGWGISYELSPPDTRASHLSFFNLGVTLQGIVGPALVTVGVVDNETVGWCALAVVFALTGVAVTACARHATAPRTTSMPAHADHTGVP